MAENEQDSGSSSGTSAATNGAGSQGQSVQQGSFDAAKLQSALESLTRRLDEVDARSKALQGDKDRGVNKTRKEVDELKAKIAELDRLKKAGLDDDSAFEELSFREDLRTVKESLQKLTGTVPGTGAGNTPTMTGEVAQVIAKAKVDANAAEVIRIVSETGNDTVELAMRLGEYKANMANRPAPDASAAHALNSAPPARTDESAKIARIQELQKNPRANKAELAKLYKEVGWE